MEKCRRLALIEDAYQESSSNLIASANEADRLAEDERLRREKDLEDSNNLNELDRASNVTVVKFIQDNVKSDYAIEQLNYKVWYSKSIIYNAIESKFS